METNEVTTAFVGSTAATNRTTASTAKATPVISRRVRSSSRRGSSVACGRAPLACFALFSAGEAALPADFVAEDAFGFAVLDDCRATPYSFMLRLICVSWVLFQPMLRPHAPARAHAAIIA